MWQAESFDPATIDRELGWAAQIGFSVMRVYLHDLVWPEDREGFLNRMEKFLGIAAKHDIKVLFTIFDDCWICECRRGPQAPPVPGRHNSRWVESPGLAAVKRFPTDSALQGRLKDYV